MYKPHLVIDCGVADGAAWPARITRIRYNQDAGVQQVVFPSNQKQIGRLLGNLRVLVVVLAGKLPIIGENLTL